MKKDKTHFCTPFLEWYGFGSDNRNPVLYNAETNAALDDLFAEVRRISPYDSNGTRELYFLVDRGSIEDYMECNNLLSEDCEMSSEEIEEMWKRDYPQEKQWFSFSFIEDDENGFRAIFKNNRLFLQTMPKVPFPSYPLDESEFVRWLIEKVRECIPDIKSGEYNRKIREELSPDLRVGTISRKAFWDIYPEEKEEYFSGLPDADRDEFLKLMENYRKDALPDNLVEDMTSGLFFRCCQMGYAANHYERSDTLSPKELYRKHADGRDEGLMNIDEDSPEAFRNWYEHREQGGHPWEVCRGGNSTHVSLYVCKADNGFYFAVAGSSWGRSIETIHFYLALHRAGMPVIIDEGNKLADRIKGKDKIGIVPKGVFPRYCSHYFPGEQILDFMNLPEEKHDEFAAKCVWRDEPEISIISD